jgi:hypothetical protein
MQEFVELGTPLFRFDKRGRIKVKIIEVIEKKNKVIIHKTILFPPSYRKNWDLKTRLDQCLWKHLEIQLEEEEETRKFSISILLIELKKGYIEKQFLLGHQSPFELDPHLD